jgi:integrase
MEGDMNRSDYLDKSESVSESVSDLLTYLCTRLGVSMPADLVRAAPAQLPTTLDDRPIARAAQAADVAAGKRVFDTYRSRLAEHTRRRQDTDLVTFATFLVAVGADAGELVSDPASWAGVTWGLVAAFVEWQLQQGYAIGSINVRLSTVKAYAKLATKAGIIGGDAYAQIALVAGYRYREGTRIDKTRETTRKGRKKAAPVPISRAQALRLKDQADPRDRLLMCLLLDHGLRVGEVASLTASDFDRGRGVLRFYRSKVDKTQQHQLSTDTADAADGYLPTARPGPLFGVDRTIRERVKQLGQQIGIVGLSPHDCRHAWATFATRAGTPVKALQDAGGWSSPAMPLRYAESAEIANAGVTLD